MVFLNPITAVLLLDIRQFQRGIERAAGELAAGGRMGRAFKGLAVMGLGATVGLAAIGVESTKMAANFDAAMERLHTQAQVPQGDIKRLSDGVLNLASKVAQSPDSLAKALFFIESNFATLKIRGFDALKTLEAAARLATIGNADLVDTVTALTSTMASGLVKVGDMSSAIGVLNATVGAGEMTMQQFDDALGGGAAAVARSFGLGIKDLGATIAVFGDNNVRGAKAGQQFIMMVRALGVPISGSNEALKRLGLTSQTLGRDMAKGGLTKAIGDLRQKLIDAKIPATEWGAMMTKLFGRRAGVGVTFLLDEFDRFKQKFKDIGNGTKTVGEAWARTKEQFLTQVHQMIAGLQALGIRLGNWLIPIVQKVIAWISKAVAWFQKHRLVTQMLGAAIGGILVASIVALIVAFVAFVGWVGVLVGAVVGIIGVLIVWAAKNKTVHAAIRFVGEVIRNTLLPMLKEAWHQIAMRVTPAIAKLTAEWGKHSKGLSQAWTIIKLVTRALVVIAGVILGTLAVALGWLVGNALKGWISAMTTVVRWISNIVHWLSVLVGAARSAAGGIRSAFGGIGAFLGGIKGAVSAIGGLLHLAEGGWVPGPIGAPQLAVVHGGEYMVSRQEMRGSGRRGGRGPGPLGGGDIVVQSHLYLDGKKIFTAVQKQSLQNNRRNRSNGLAVTGVATGALA